MGKTRQWSLLTAVAVLVVFVAGWFLLVKPQNSHASDLRTQTANQQSQNAQLEAQIASLKAEQKGLGHQQKALQAFSTKVPDNPAEPAILRQLSTAANGSGVDMLSLTTGTPSAVSASASTATTLAPTTAGGTLMELPLSIGVDGPYANLESFFLSIEKLPRAMEIGSWSLCPDAGSGDSGVTATSGTTSSCSPPNIPQGRSVPSDTLGGVLSAVVYYAPTSGSSGVSSSGTPSTTTASPAPTASAATPSTTPAPSTAASAPAN
jgi:Tfp pilus assembly protein PilO